MANWISGQVACGGYMDSRSGLCPWTSSCLIPQLSLCEGEPQVKHTLIPFALLLCATSFNLKG